MPPHSKPRPADPSRPAKARGSDAPRTEAERVAARPRNAAGHGGPADEVRQSRERDRLFELSLDLMCIAGTDGYFKQVNPAFERVLGYDEAELLSHAFLEFVHPEDRERTLAEMQRLAQGLPVVDFQNRYRARDGMYRWLAWRAAPQAGTDRVYAVARDITEQRLTHERMLEQAEALARSNADLEQFVSVASHDLRAPLRTIDHLAEWIDEDLPNAPEKVREQLANIRRRVKRMDAMIGDLLRYHRAGRETAAHERVDSAELVRDLATLLTPPGGFKVEGRPGLPVIETSRTALELVLRNLISNAIEHHDEPDGHVSVSARRRGRFFEFTVEDDGPGIAPEHHARIFEMFHKLETGDAGGGTGVGLAFVKRVVERYGGEVDVTSREGRGASFTFTWPLAAADIPLKDDDDPHR